MGALVFICPASGREVVTGLDMDPDTYRDLPKVLAEIKCPQCGLTHNLFEVEARLVGDDPNPAEAS